MRWFLVSASWSLSVLFLPQQAFAAMMFISVYGALFHRLMIFIHHLFPPPAYANGASNFAYWELSPEPVAGAALDAGAADFQQRLHRFLPHDAVVWHFPFTLLPTGLYFYSRRSRPILSTIHPPEADPGRHG